MMGKNKLYLILLLILLYIILPKKKKNNIENFDNSNDYNYFQEKLKKYPKKKYILIFTSGPTLNNFKKRDIPDKIWEDCYVIAVKNSINYLDKIKVKPDFLVTNFVGAGKNIDLKLVDKLKPFFIGLKYGDFKELEKRVNFTVNLDKRILMQNVKNNVNDIAFKNDNNKIVTGWGHIMMELAIPLALELKPNYIITVGWDVKNSKLHFHETFVISYWHDENNIINNFTTYLHKFLLHHYKIKIFKFSKDSGIKIPLFDSKTI